MKSKTLILAALMSVLLISGNWAIGIGAQFNANISNISRDAGFIPGWAIAISPQDNLHFAVFWDFAEEHSSIFGLTADLWLLNPDLLIFGSTASLGLFAGPGLYGSFSTANNGTINFGIRIPVGVNLHFAQRVLEVYLYAAPSWGINLIPSLALGDLSIPISLGFRFWIR